MSFTAEPQGGALAPPPSQPARRGIFQGLEFVKKIEGQRLSVANTREGTKQRGTNVFSLQAMLLGPK